MSLKQEYHNKMEATMKEWSAKLDELTAKAQGAQAETKIQLNQEIEALRLKQEAAQEQLRRLKEAGDDAWEDVKSGIETAWEDIAQAFQAAKSKLK